MKNTCFEPFKDEYSENHEKQKCKDTAKKQVTSMPD